MIHYAGIIRIRFKGCNLSNPHKRAAPPINFRKVKKFFPILQFSFPSAESPLQETGTPPPCKSVDNPHMISTATPLSHIQALIF